MSGIGWPGGDAAVERAGLGWPGGSDGQPHRRGGSGVVESELSDVEVDLTAQRVGRASTPARSRAAAEGALWWEALHADESQREEDLESTGSSGAVAMAEADDGAPVIVEAADQRVSLERTALAASGWGAATAPGPSLVGALTHMGPATEKTGQTGESGGAFHVERGGVAPAEGLDQEGSATRHVTEAGDQLLTEGQLPVRTRVGGQNDSLGSDELRVDRLSVHRGIAHEEDVATYDAEVRDAAADTPSPMRRHSVPPSPLPSPSLPTRWAQATQGLEPGRASEGSFSWMTPAQNRSAEARGVPPGEKVSDRSPGRPIDVSDVRPEAPDPVDDGRPDSPDAAAPPRGAEGDDDRQENGPMVGGGRPGHDEGRGAEEAAVERPTLASLLHGGERPALDDGVPDASEESSASEVAVARETTATPPRADAPRTIGDVAGALSGPAVPGTAAHDEVSSHEPPPVARGAVGTESSVASGPGSGAVDAENRMTRAGRVTVDAENVTTRRGVADRRDVADRGGEGGAAPERDSRVSRETSFTPDGESVAVVGEAPVGAWQDLASGEDDNRGDVPSAPSRSVESPAGHMSARETSVPRSSRPIDGSAGSDDEDGRPSVAIASSAPQGEMSEQAKAAVDTAGDVEVTYDELERVNLVRSLPSFDETTPLAVEVAEDARRRITLSGRPFPSPPRTRMLTVANQKGGVGKTTTTVNLAAALAQAGLNVLVLDIDPQGNASTALGIDHHSDIPSLYDVVVEGMPLREVLQACPDVPNLWCAPATIDLAGAEIELVSLVARETRLQKALATYLEERAAAGLSKIDYVFVDCPPSLSLLTVNAFVAAREVLIPIQCEYYALEGLSQLLKHVDLIRGHLNPDLHVSTILLTMYDGRTRLSAQVADEVRGHFPEQVVKTAVPRSVRISEAPSHGQTVMTYDPASSGALSYLEAARELAEQVLSWTDRTMTEERV